MLVCSKPFQNDVTALDWSTDGTFIAVGDRKGTARILDAKTLETLGSMDAFNANGK